MENKVRLQDYFKRIGYTGDAKPNLETLKAIQFQQVNHIPFENLNPLLKIPVDLDLESVQRKILDHKRGGYCYENNSLLLAVLQEIGFDARGITGRVFFKMPIETIIQRTHMIVLVHLDGKDYICDTGFGAQVPTVPLLLHTSEPQPTTHEDYRIITYEGDNVLQSFVKEEWINMYRFDLIKQNPIDYKLGNYYTSTHSDSSFTKRLVVTIVGKDKRMAVHNNEFVVHHLNGPTDKTEIKSIEELENLLLEVFNVEIPKVDGYREVLGKVMKK